MDKSIKIGLILPTIIISVLIGAVVILSVMNNQTTSSNHFYNEKITLKVSLFPLKDASINKWINITAQQNDSINITIKNFYSATEDVLEIHFYNNNSVHYSELLGYYAFINSFLWNTTVKDNIIDYDREYTIKIETDGLYWFYFGIVEKFPIINYPPTVSFQLIIDIE